MLIPTVLDVASKRSERSGWLKVAAAAIGLAGSLALRWSIVYGGHESADDPKIAREATKPEV